MTSVNNNAISTITKGREAQKWARVFGAEVYDWNQYWVSNRDKVGQLTPLLVTYFLFIQTSR